MPAFKPVPVALIERFDASLPVHESLQRRKMFGCPCAFVNGNMFAGLHEDRLVLKLGQEARDEMVRQGMAQAFTVNGRTMREYLVLPNAIGLEEDEMKSWIERAYRFARALPPKVAKAPGRRGKTSG